MRVIGLDLSTKSGWAFLEDGKLIKYGLVTVETNSFPLPYPANLCAAAQAMAINLINVIQEFIVEGQKLDVVIEDTNLGPQSQRYAQKILEFIHCSMIAKLLEIKIIPIFVNSSDWRKLTGVVMTDQARQNNDALVTKKEQQKQALLNSVKQTINRKYNPLVSKCKTKKDLRDLTSKMKAEQKDLEAYFLKGLRAPNGKITYKHLSVERVNTLFNKNFIQADNDICDAILIGLSRFPGTMIKKENQNG